MRENSQKIIYILTENILLKKIFVHPLGLKQNCIAGTKRANPSWQYRSI